MPSPFEEWVTQKGLEIGGSTTPVVRTFPDGSLRQWVPDATHPDGGEWIVVAPAPRETTVITHEDGSKWLHDASTGEPIRQLTGPVAESTKRDTQLVTLADGSKVLMDMQTGEVIRQVSGPAARQPSAAELQLAAQQRQAELWRQVARGEMKPEDAISSFEEWYTINVERPRQQAQLALSAGQQSVENFLATLPYRVGPTFGQEIAGALTTLSGGGGRINFSPSAFTFEMPDLTQLAQQGAARALAMISPTASGRIGQPMPSFLPEGAPMPSFSALPPYTPASVPASTPAPAPAPAPVPPYTPPVAVAGTRHGGFTPW